MFNFSYFPDSINIINKKIYNPGITYMKPNKNLKFSNKNFTYEIYIETQVRFDLFNDSRS